MAQRPLTITLTSAALAAAVVAAGSGVAFAQSSPTEASGQPTVARPGVEVVAGTLSPESFQSSIDEANAKIVAMRAAVVAKWQADAAQAAMNAAVVANWVAQAEAAEQAAAAAAEAERIAYEQSVAAAAYAAQSYSAPAQSYSAPAQSYSAPAAETYAAPAATSYSSSGAATGDAASWASSGAAMAVKQCESGNNYSTNTGNGYYGAWQFDAASWLANGGGAYAPTADQAPAWAQDQVAYNYYSVAGWGPWACAQ